MRVSTRAAAMAAAVGMGLLAASPAGAFPAFTPVPHAQPRIAGISEPTLLPPRFQQVVVAQGSHPLDGGTAEVPYYGYDGDGPMLPAPGDVPSDGHLVEASKTEPDKNTYLVLSGQGGPDAGYAYGTHFLFQGHEAGAPGEIT